MSTDIDAIRRLADDYCWHADTHNVQGIVDLFTDDGVMDATAVGMDTIRGREALHAFYETIIPLHEWSQHLTGTHRIDVDGDNATGTAYYLMHGAVKDGGPISAAGYFEDVYVRTADGWRFVSRRGVPLGPPNISELIGAMETPGCSP